MCIMVNQKLQHDLGTQRTPSIVNPPGESHDLSFHLPNCNCQHRYQRPRRRNNLAERPFQPGGLNRRFVNGVTERDRWAILCDCFISIVTIYIAWRLVKVLLPLLLSVRHVRQSSSSSSSSCCWETHLARPIYQKRRRTKKNTWPAIPWALAKSKTKQNRNTIITLLCTIVRNREDELCGQVTRMLYWWVFPFTFFSTKLQNIANSEGQRDLHRRLNVCCAESHTWDGIACSFDCAICDPFVYSFIRLWHAFALASKGAKVITTCVCVCGDPP